MGRRLVATFAVLALLNVGGWLWALIAFHATPALLGIALLVYGLGIRHAVDADHIAAIDNVTRKLMQHGQRPLGVGLFFALGHSSVVVLMTAAVAGAAAFLRQLESWQETGGAIGTTFSALFLLAIAVMNLTIFASLYRNYRRLRRGGPYVAEDLDILLNSRGVLARLFRPLFRLVTRSWHMFPLGLLLGLGFDTATEVAMFGVSAAQVDKGIPPEAIVALPVLFAAGMSLVDTADGVLMLGAYNWAFVKPIRKLYYNMTITLVSVLVALLIGGIEALGLISGRLGLTGGAWDGLAALSGNLDRLGFVILGLFAATWALSWIIYRARRLDEIDLHAPV
ncbi:MAG: HoxN/HupN/NixA family nickel/cobalt transporter [Devosia sp.]